MISRCRNSSLAGFFYSLLLTMVATPAFAGGDFIRVAVASNFTKPLAEIARLFEQQQGHEVILSSGSSGKQYAQISHGAPFDLYFSADADRPLQLEQKGLIVPGTRISYALGRLALWNPNAESTQAQALEQTGRKLAIANPRLAPYGRAAQQTLQHIGLWEKFQGYLIRGENIAQTYHFVHSGSAPLGLVALSQLRDTRQPAKGSFWLVPADHHDPIEQQAVRLTDKPAARQFMTFIKSAQARDIIERYGYEVPE